MARSESLLRDEAPGLTRGLGRADLELHLAVAALEEDHRMDRPVVDRRGDAASWEAA